MPPSPLDSRHDPEQPDEAVPQPTKEERFQRLQAALMKVEYRLLGEGFPTYTVLPALEKAESTGIDAICGDLHDRMKLPPERMTPASFHKWLRVVARRAAITLLRRKRTVSLADGDVLPAPQATDDAQDINMILDALKTMPPDLREVIEALYFEGLSGREAAKRLAIPEATFQRRKALAINCLRTIFDQLSENFDPSAARSQAIRVQ
jgi:RNA polymerase sigma factor (sigma-70 family)